MSKRNPNRYKEKTCTVCGTKHRKRGVFCSKSCSNSQRPISDNIRENMKQVGKDFSLTPEGIANRKMFVAGTLTASEDFAIQIPDTKSLDDYDDFLDGYDKGENW